MKEKLTSLIDVKTIITFTVTAVFAYLSITGKLTVDQFMIIASMIFTYFFAKRSTADQDLTK